MGVVFFFAKTARIHCTLMLDDYNLTLPLGATGIDGDAEPFGACRVVGPVKSWHLQ